MQLMWSNIRLDPQIKDKTGQRTVLVVMILYIHVNRSWRLRGLAFQNNALFRSSFKIKDSEQNLAFFSGKKYENKYLYVNF